jgi:hypothetical protein
MNETRKKIIDKIKRVIIFYGKLYLHSCIQKINVIFKKIEAHPQGPQAYIPYTMKYKILFPILSQLLHITPPTMLSMRISPFFFLKR